MTSAPKLTEADWRALNAEWARRAAADPRGLRQLALSTGLADWVVQAREDQLAPPGDWTVWLLLAGRGAGKTRAGAEWVKQQVDAGAQRIALVAPTAADVRDTMVEGESGLLSVYPPGRRPHYESSKRRITWPHGAIATLFSADEPDRLRGPQHEAAWADELAAWNRADDAWANLMMGLRLGQSRCCVTTTPRPIPIIRSLMDRADADVAVTRASTRANFGNLSRAFREQIIAQYEGTRLGRQELDAEILEDVPGALWSRDMIEAQRAATVPTLKRIVVGVDPAATSGDSADHTGVVVAGVDHAGQGYVLEDRSLRASPDGWGREAVQAYHRWQADRIVAEKNQGGEMVQSVMRTVDRQVPIKLVHASRGKQTRAEPVAALYEQGKVYHAARLDRLEDEMCSYDGEGDSPDRLDASVWGLTELMLNTPVTAESRRVRGLM